MKEESEMNQFFYRDVIDKVKEHMKSKDIIVLIGSRQVGKTTILKILGKSQEKDEGAAVYYFDAEIPDHMEIFSSYSNFLSYFNQIITSERRVYIYLDEFQKIPHINKVLKIVHDHHENVKLLVSGSSSLEIQKKVEESLAGRKKVIEVYPLSFREVLRFNKEDELLSVFDNFSLNASVIPFFDRFFNLFMDYSIWGGYPKVVIAKNKNEKIFELEDIYKSYIEKDIKSFLRDENVIAFNKLLKLISVNIGSLSNLNILTQQLGIARVTLERYIFILENTFIIKKVNPYFKNKLKEISKMPKLYFHDTGLRNYAISNFNQLVYRSDGGFLLENAILIELLKKNIKLLNINFWRTKTGQEIDFVLSKESRVILAESKLSTPKQLPLSFSAFTNHNKVYKKYLLGDKFSKDLKGSVIALPFYLSSKLI